MVLLNKILNKFIGFYYPQEYLCLSKESFGQPLSVYAVEDNKVIEDVTKRHAFVGYCPLVFCIDSERKQLLPKNITIVFAPVPLELHARIGKKDIVARLELREVAEFGGGGERFRLYEGVKGKHRFISSIKQLAGDIHNKLYKQKAGNVFLKGNLLKQVQIAYAVPRNVSLITVGQDRTYNLFPTDLHGEAGCEHYIISLRHAGKACAQVVETGRILVSEMEAKYFKQVYSLGKNHMQPLKEASAFTFSSGRSSCFDLPVPDGATYLRELELKDSFVAGIHRIMLFKVKGTEKRNANAGTLAHVHNVYATWRYKQGVESNYLLR